MSDNAIKVAVITGFFAILAAATPGLIQMMQTNRQNTVIVQSIPDSTSPTTQQVQHPRTQPSAQQPSKLPVISSQLPAASPKPPVIKPVNPPISQPSGVNPPKLPKPPVTLPTTATDTVHIQEVVQEFQSVSATSTTNSASSLALELTTNQGLQPVYKNGEAFSVMVRASQDCYLHVYYVQANGEIFRIFPNAYYPNSKIKGNTTYILPDDCGFELEIDCSQTSGIEVVKAVASLSADMPDIPGQNIEYGLRGIKVKPKKIMNEYRKNPNIVEAMLIVTTIP